MNYYNYRRMDLVIKDLKAFKINHNNQNRVDTIINKNRAD